MIVTFSQKFPEEHKERIRKLIAKSSHYLDFPTYEVHVDLRCAKGALASIHVTPQSHRAEVHLNRHRLTEPILERDLVHELLHIPLWPQQTALDDIVRSVPVENRRTLQRVLTRQLELQHDAIALSWQRALPLLPDPPEEK